MIVVITGFLANVAFGSRVRQFIFVEILHFYIPERYERRLRFLSHTDGRIAKAIVIAKRLCAFRSMPVKAKCAEGNTDDKLSPSSVMYSTQLACKNYLCSTTKGILASHSQ